jgi:hypothetical protein
MLDQLFAFVIIFGNDCSKFEQLTKRSCCLPCNYMTERRNSLTAAAQRTASIAGLPQKWGVLITLAEKFIGGRNGFRNQPRLRLGCSV